MPVGGGFDLADARSVLRALRATAAIGVEIAATRSDVPGEW